jgi:hypothetical protein
MIRNFERMHSNISFNEITMIIIPAAKRITKWGNYQKQQYVCSSFCTVKYFVNELAPVYVRKKVKL